MNKVWIGILFGIIAGIIDVVPMVMQKLTWDANLGALSLWVVSGFFIATTSLQINSYLKGVLISILVLIPTAFLIGWHQPATLTPIFLITIILGALLGFTIDKFGNKTPETEKVNWDEETK